MKTAMQEFREWYNSYVNENGSSPSDWDVNYFINHYFELKEKEQIIDANITGMEFIAVHPDHYKVDAEEYYNQTYNQNK